jgi:hypothetical protein
MTHKEPEMTGRKTYRTLFRYPGDDTVRATMFGDIRNQLQRGEDEVFIQLTADGLQRVSFKWKIKDLMSLYEIEVEEAIAKASTYLDMGYVYAPYIPLQESP